MRTTVAVVQAGTEGTDTEATLTKAETLIAECGRRGVKVAVFPEAFIGGYLKRSQFPSDIRNVLTDDPEAVLMRGGSMIVGPLGNVLAGPHFDGETIPTADIDTDDMTRAHFDLDVNGHYSRPDLFSLSVNQDPLRSVVSASTAHEEPAR